jgi:hypothetical protein
VPSRESGKRRDQNQSNSNSAAGLLIGLDRIMPQLVTIVGVLIAERNGEHLLANQRANPM